MAYGNRRFEKEKGVEYVSYFTRHLERQLLKSLREKALAEQVSLEQAFNDTLKMGLEVFKRINESSIHKSS